MSKSSRDVRIRLIAAPLVLLFLGAILWWHDHSGNPIGTDLLIVLFGAGAGIEMASLLSKSGRPVSSLFAGIACGALCGVGIVAPDSASARHDWRVWLLIASFVFLLMRHLLDTRPEAVERIAHAMLPVLYVGVLLSLARELMIEPLAARRLAWVVLVAKASDIGGWVVGKAIGKHKMVPSVSPGKSWEGTAGGIAFSVVVAVFGPQLVGLPEAAWSGIERVGFGVLLATVSILAGVTQSGWKRRTGVKDSSTLIPEMGGLLDMADSILFAAPTAVLWYRFVAPMGA